MSTLFGRFTNQAWQQFSAENGGTDAACGVGVNYLEVCKGAKGEWAQEAPALAQGIQEVIAGRQQVFDLEYPCHSPSEQRWFDVNVTRFSGEGPVCVVVAHENITALKGSETTLRESNEKFYQLADNIDVVFWIRSPDMSELQYISPAYERIWGRPIESLYENPQQWGGFVAPEDRERVEGIYSALTRDTPRISAEYRIMRPDGEVRWVSSGGFQVRNDTGKLIRLAGIISDITERKNAEEELRQSAANLAKSQQMAHLGSWELDLINLDNINSNSLRWSDELHRIFGYEPGQIEVTNEVFFRAVHPDDRPTLSRMMAEAIQRGRPYAIEHRIILPDGRERIVQSQSEILYKEQTGQPFKVVGLVQDITKRKAAEEALRKNETKFRTMFETSLDAILLANDDGLYVDANPAACALLGLAHEQLMGRSIADFVSPATQDATRAAFKDFLRDGQQSGEFEFQQPDGSHRQAEFRAVAGLQPGVHMAVMRDISERKLTEATLLESEARFRTAISEAPVPIMIHREDGKVLQISKGWTKHSGYDLEEVPTIQDWAERAGEASAEAHEYMKSLYQIEETRSEGEWTITAKNGQKRIWDFITTPLGTFGNNQRVVISTAFDITESKQAKEALEQSQQRLALATESAHIGIWDWDIIENMLVWDAEMVALYGIRVPDFSGPYNAWQSTLHPEDRKQAEATVSAALDGSRDFHSQFRVIWPNGEVHHIEARGFVQRAEDGSAVRMIGVNWDITGLKQAEEALQMANDDLELRVEKRTVELQAQVLERERAEREVRAQARQHEALAEIGRRALLDIDLATLLEEAVSLIASTLEVDMCSFWERAPDSDNLQFRAGVGLNEQMRSAVDKQIGDNTQIGYTAFLNEPVIVEDLTQENRFSPALYLVEMGITSLITVPVYNGVLFGVLAACSPHKKNFRQNEVLFLQSVANVLASALARYQTEVEILKLNTNLQGVNEALRVENIQHQMTMETLRHLAAALQLAKEEAEHAMIEANAANAAKSEFLSRMSHELRTPLNAILGFGQILEIQNLTPRQHESIGYILKGGRHLLGLINEVLDIARVEAGHSELSLEPIALHEVVPEVCALLRPLAEERHIQLEENSAELGRCYIVADLQRFKQVLINLLSNAIKYNRDGGQAEVLCTLKSEGGVSIAVRDTGMGLSAEDLPKLFTPFERLGAADSQIEGTGLGLVLSQRLVTAMGGTLEVESTLGQGTTFTLKLPQADIPQEQVTHSPRDNRLVEASTTPHAAHCVLCIEDNLSNLRLIEAILEGRPGITLLSAMQGSIGLDLARQHEPDLILLDLDLPDIKGSEVLLRLQQSALTRDIPVVVVSADATSRQIERLLSAGAKAYLTKPLDVGQFLSTLDECLVVPQDKETH